MSYRVEEGATVEQTLGWMCPEGTAYVSWTKLGRRCSRAVLPLNPRRVGGGYSVTRPER